MFDDLMKQFTEQHNKLIDELTFNLLNKAGIYLSKDYSNLELIMVMQDMKAKGYEIKFKKCSYDKTWLCLYKNDWLEYGYEFDIKVQDNKVIMTAIPIE